MAEVVENAGVTREKGYLYFLRGTNVFKQVTGRGIHGRGIHGVPSKVYEGKFEREDGYMYFLDKDGNIARARLSVGGQPRKKPAAKKPAAKKPAAKKPAAKKPAAKSRGRRA